MSATPNLLDTHPHAVGAGSRARQVARFILHLVEMTIPMVLGMMLFDAVATQLRPVPGIGPAFRSGTDLNILGDALFMSLPMVAWMVVRRHGWRHSLEMAASMIVPGVAIIVLARLGSASFAYALRDGACGWMCLGMPVYMLFRYDHFAGRGAHAAHASHTRG